MEDDALHETALVVRNVSTTASLLQVPAPATPLEVRLLPSPAGWTLLAFGGDGTGTDAEDWLNAVGVSRIEHRAVRDPAVVRASIRRLPPPFEVLATDCTLRHARFLPDGTAQLTVAGPTEVLEAAVARLARDEHDAAPLLTARQEQLLDHCIAQGYYEIPRRTNLRTLGRQLGITATSLSLVLRRAEAKIVPRYPRRHGSFPDKAAFRDRAASQ